MIADLRIRGAMTFPKCAASGMEKRGAQKAGEPLPLIHTPSTGPRAGASGVVFGCQAHFNQLLRAGRSVSCAKNQTEAMDTAVPIAGLLDRSHALPPRRKISIHWISPPPARGHPLLPGAKANSPWRTAKAPSLTIASCSLSLIFTRIYVHGVTILSL